jgi:hypothetical protein
MNTKLTLRMDEALVRHAKTEAAQRGKSVSQMFSEFVLSLGASKRATVLPPVTDALRGIVKNSNLSEEDYKEHLLEKHS